MVMVKNRMNNPTPAELQPTRVTDPNEYQPIEIEELPRPRRGCGCGCLPLSLIVLIILLGYFLFPARTNILVLGVDRTPDGTALGRTDTNILVSVIPLKPTVNMLSIPRDLWVTLPDGSQNRINTAHFFAEAANPGSGPEASMETVRNNFGVTVNYYARFQFASVIDIVDAMGGVNIVLDSPTAGYDAGSYTLNGEQALAFARSRSSSDDFFRMQHGQLLIKAAFKQMLDPKYWPRIPEVAKVSLQSVKTNLPIYLWPRLGLAVLRAGPDGIDNRTIDRTMVTGWTTDMGANVLLPNWDAINPVLMEMFGE